MYCIGNNNMVSFDNGSIGGMLSGRWEQIEQLNLTEMRLKTHPIKLFNSKKLMVHSVCNKVD